MRAIVLLFLFIPFTALGSDPNIWTVGSRAEVLKGDARGVSIDANGTISLAPRLTEVYRTEQPFIWSMAADASGNVFLGTGSDGRIYKVTRAGVGSLFTDFNELNVTALAIGRNGEVFAATAPDGRVYRIDAAGTPQPYFDPKEKYIWSMAILIDGSLVVGTGDGGKIYLVRGAGAAPAESLLFDTSESHIISLAVNQQGELFAGTDPGGLVLRFGNDGRPFALLDSPLREVHELAVSADGTLYALVLGESASVATPAASPSPATAVISERTGPIPQPTPEKSRYDLTNARSAVYALMPGGAGSDIIWSSLATTGFALYAKPDNSGVLLGTSDKGRIFNITRSAREMLMLQSDANQISLIRNIAGSLYAVSSNQGTLFRVGPETVSEGSYESAVLDAKAVATWGRIWWQASGAVEIETRSGNTEKPDQTWSQWTRPSAGVRSGQVTSPKARFLQWRAVLRSGSATSLGEVNVSYLGRNIAPEVLSINVLPTNVGLIANPPIQIDPNIALSGLEPSAFGIQPANAPPRRAYLRGARSVQWTAEDRNGDKLLFDIYLREASENEFKLLRAGIDENFFVIDGQSVADGRYTAKVVARDMPSNPSTESLSGERISEPFDIDNTQPSVTAIGTPQVTASSARLVFAAADRWGYIVRAEYSINGGAWSPIYADDGISDGPEERYTVAIQTLPAGEVAVTLRVFDSQGNAGTGRQVITR